jgi:hypothetical protein
MQAEAADVLQRVGYCASLSRLPFGLPPRFHARHPLKLTPSSSHISASE